jgi:RNA polymerase sigma-70 factor (ECF subfamily)
MTDSQEIYWLIAAQAGDMDAYTALMEQLQPEVARFVRRLIDHTESVEDIVQDVFLKFYLNMHRIHPPDNLRPYLFRIARNACYDELRRYGRDAGESLDDEPVEIRVSFISSHQQPKPDDLTHWMLLGMEVRTALDLLPEVQRQTLVLYCEEGMSYAEIAEVMEVSIGTVKSRLHHAKKGLRARLKPETIEILEEEFGLGHPVVSPESVLESQ